MWHFEEACSKTRVFLGDPRSKLPSERPHWVAWHWWVNHVVWLLALFRIWFWSLHCTSVNHCLCHTSPQGTCDWHLHKIRRCPHLEWFSHGAISLTNFFFFKMAIRGVERTRVLEADTLGLKSWFYHLSHICPPATFSESFPSYKIEILLKHTRVLGDSKEEA